jgi:hypothetical protein
MIMSAVTAGWILWFAWYPVTVDAYSQDEIKNGHFTYTVWWRFVEYQWYEWTDIYEDGAPIKHAFWRYRLHK